MACKKVFHPKTNTLWRLEELVALSGPQLKRRLLEIMASSEDAQERYWDRVDVRNEDECWLWTTTLCKANHCGIFNISPRDGLCVRMKAHRISYFLAHGVLPDHLDVCHHCDNPACCNPHHLFLGTQDDNMKDCYHKGRNTKGEQVHWHKLKEKDVLQIRKRFARGGVTVTDIAREYKMSHFAIRCVVERRTWKHLPA